MNKFQLLGLVFGIAVAVAFVAKVFFTTFAADSIQFAEWETTPKIIICRHDSAYLDAPVNFWNENGFEFSSVSETWHCPQFVKGAILVSVDTTGELTESQLGKTVFPLGNNNVIDYAHIYVKTLSYNDLDQITLAHELGHALGFSHTNSDASNHIMNPNPLRQKWSFK